MGELCCLEFYVSAVRAHSFELLGRHKARKKRDRGFVWSANKRRRRDRPRHAVSLPGIPRATPISPRANTWRYIPFATTKTTRRTLFDRNRAFVICLRGPKRFSEKIDLGSATCRVVSIVRPRAHWRNLPKDEADELKLFSTAEYD